jgi:predicted ester cyclase
VSTERRLTEFVESLRRDVPAAVGRFVSPEFFGYTPAPGELSATQRLADLADDLVAALPDLSASIVDLSGEGPHWAGVLHLSGTHTNALWGAPGTGKAIEWITPIDIREIGDRFAVRIDAGSFPDLLEVLHLLGVVNAPDEMDLPPHNPVAIPEFVLKLVFTGQAADVPCTHLDQIRTTEPPTRLCAQCFAVGDNWPSLRMCVTCGAVGCCDTAKNKHARAHYEATGHPIVRAVRMDERWGWCYEDDAFFEGDRLAEAGGH